MININSVSDCATPALGNILLALRTILTIIQIIGPILLIISLLINFTKGTMNPDDKKLNKKIINSIIAVVLLFSIPLFINVVMGVVGENYTVSDCWNNIYKKSSNNKSEYKDPYEKDKTKVINDDEYEKSEDGEASTEENNNN